MKRPFLIGFGVVGLLLILGFLVTEIMGAILGTRAVTTPELFTRESIRQPLMAFRADNQRYPTTAEGLAALIHAPKGLEATWKGPYLDDELRLIDPWGRRYRYHCPGVHHPTGYDIWSLGPDGKVSPDDIGNW